MRNHSQHPADMMTLGFTKVAGFHPWLGYDADFDWNYNYFWKSTIRAQQHMNGDDVINTLSEGGGNWGHGKDEAVLKKKKSGYSQNLVEHQYYGGYHADMTVGYVRNRSFNTYTNGCRENPFPYLLDPRFYEFTSITKNKVKNSEKIMIISLKNLTHYFVDWYSYNTGTYIKTDYKKTSFNGNLKLDFPVLTSANPVVWYVVHQNAYSGLIQGQTPITEREQVLFVYQEVDNDTTSIAFKNSIYPNPFNNKIIVNSLEDDVFIITSLTGKLIISLHVQKGINVINLQDLPIGLYLGELKKQHFITKLERL